ncbi:MAG: hypothetical protein Q8R00_01315 [Candidatus Nanoarchaeia archaeon]|nr:hypothetical protein [Candidatus Nanoarchaeia archaeon]
MAMSFKYKTVKRPDGTTVKTPSIPVLFKGNKDTVEVVALIDSGADISAMPQAIAEILGLDLGGKITPAFGIGGKVDSVEAKLTTIVEKGHEHYTFQIPIKIILGDYDLPILLGRAGFFDKFVISFDQSMEKVSLKRIIRK